MPPQHWRDLHCDDLTRRANVGDKAHLKGATTSAHYASLQAGKVQGTQTKELADQIQKARRERIRGRLRPHKDRLQDVILGGGNPARRARVCGI